MRQGIVSICQQDMEGRRERQMAEEMRKDEKSNSNKK
jgi:hypothetical protein